VNRQFLRKCTGIDGWLDQATIVGCVLLPFQSQSRGFSPFAEIVEGMKNVSAINAEYLERPDQGSLARYGNKYVFEEFPNIDYIVKATFVEDATAGAAGSDANSPKPN
jgi:hypothetical protein